MTRKDYVLISEAINGVWQDGDTVRPGVLVTARFIALALAKDNPRFDTERFMEACTR